MDSLSIALERSVRVGRDHTLADASATARHTGADGLESSMSQTAEHELFTEALLAAAKSRFEEIKTVTK